MYLLYCYLTEGDPDVIIREADCSETSQDDIEKMKEEREEEDEVKEEGEDTEKPQADAVQEEVPVQEEAEKKASPPPLQDKELDKGEMEEVSSEAEAREIGSDNGEG